MLLDPSLGQTEYVEDCEICCNPINVVYGFEDKNLTHFEAHKPEGDFCSIEFVSTVPHPMQPYNQYQQLSRLVCTLCLAHHRKRKPRGYWFWLIYPL